MRSAITGFLFFLITFGSAMAAGQDPAIVQAIKARYVALDAAFDNRDEPALNGLVTLDFANIGVDGKVRDLSQLMQEIKATPKDPFKSGATTVISVSPIFGGVSVKQRYDTKTIKLDPTGKRTNVAITAYSADTWLNGDGVWRLQQTVTDKVDYYLNGKLAQSRNRQPSEIPTPGID